MTTTSRTLRAAWRKSGLSLTKLKGKAGLKLTNASMSRKLAGKQPMAAGEIAAIATALGFDVAITPESISIGKPKSGSGDSDKAAA